MIKLFFLLCFNSLIFSYSINIKTPFFEKVHQDLIYKFKIHRGEILNINSNSNLFYILFINEKPIKLPYICKENTYAILKVRTKKSTLIQVLIKPSLPFPVKGANMKDIGGTFLVKRGKRLHQGIDIFAKKNTPVLAVKDNLVVVNDFDNPLGGINVILYDTKEAIYYYYAHLTLVLVEKGDIVKKNQIIGTVGNTGNAESTPNHLHFGVYDKLWTKAIDPLPFVYKYGNFDIKFLFKMKNKKEYDREKNNILSEGYDYINIIDHGSVKKIKIS